MNALLIVDVQNDFVSGSLAVPGAVEIIPVINKLIDRFSLIISTQDWHPPDHVSFSQWPVHCVAGTEGARFAPDLNVHWIKHTILKNSHHHIYGGFLDEEGQHTGLADYLLRMSWDIEDTLFICGLATEYCVKYTALQAAKIGIQTQVILDACRALTLDGERHAVAELMTAGVSVSKGFLS